MHNVNVFARITPIPIEELSMVVKTVENISTLG
jgi:hypothetical protein